MQHVFERKEWWVRGHQGQPLEFVFLEREKEEEFYKIFPHPHMSQWCVADGNNNDNGEVIKDEKIERSKMKIILLLTYRKLRLYFLHLKTIFISESSSSCVCL